MGKLTLQLDTRYGPQVDRIQSSVTAQNQHVNQARASLGELRREVLESNSEKVDGLDQRVLQSSRATIEESIPAFLKDQRFNAVLARIVAEVDSRCTKSVEAVKRDVEALGKLHQTVTEEQDGPRRDFAKHVDALEGA